jgi:hypothetical protein
MHHHQIAAPDAAESTDGNPSSGTLDPRGLLPYTSGSPEFTDSGGTPLSEAADRSSNSAESSPTAAGGIRLENLGIRGAGQRRGLGVGFGIDLRWGEREGKKKLEIWEEREGDCEERDGYMEHGRDDERAWEGEGDAGVLGRERKARAFPHFALVEAFVRARAARLGVSLLARPGEVTAGGPVLTLRGQVGGASSDFPRALPAPANLSLTS